MLLQIYFFHHQSETHSHDVLFLNAIRNGAFPLSEMKYLSPFMRFITFNNSSTTFTLFLYFLFRSFLLSSTNCTTSSRSFSSVPGLVSALGRPAYESDIGRHQPDTFFLEALAKLRKATISFVMSVCPFVRPHGTTRLTLDEFFVTFDISVFSKICPENPTFINI
jgi:hypothetical protein